MELPTAGGVLRRRQVKPGEAPGIEWKRCAIGGQRPGQGQIGDEPSEKQDHGDRTVRSRKQVWRHGVDQQLVDDDQDREAAGRREGTGKLYRRAGDAGRKIELRFGPNCGSTVFWNAEFVPDLIGIAFGAFADRSMPQPTVSVWETTRHRWVTFDQELARFGRQIEPIHGTVTVRR